jgi:hypothetical protein
VLTRISHTGADLRAVAARQATERLKYWWLWVEGTDCNFSESLGEQ